MVYARITRRLVPFLFLCYAAAYLDRVNLSFAQLQLQDDLQFSDTVYGIGAAMFFVGYIVFEVPSNLLLQRVGAKWWIARIMVSWALISAAMALTTSPTTFYVLRFLLGVAEAGFIPGVLLYLTYWFPAARRGRVTAIFLAAIPVATIVGGPASGLVLGALDEVGGLHGWQWMFVIEAVPSLLLGLLVLRYLDNGVDDARWLTEEEKDVVRRDLAAEQDAKEGGHGDLRAALASGRVWLLCAIYFTIALGIYVVSFWLPKIIKGSGVNDPLTIGLLTAVPYVVTIAVMVSWSMHADRTGERRWHTLIPLVVTGVGLFAAALSLQSTVLAVVSMCVVAAGVSTAQAAFWSIPSAFLSGTGAAAGIAFINSVGNVGGAVATALPGWLSDLTGSTAVSLVPFGVVLILGGLLVVLVPRAVNDAGRAGTPDGADRAGGEDGAMTHHVTDDDTAIALGSGDVPVLATPRLIAWLEAATVAAAAPHLAEGRTSVGTAVRVRHRRPTPVGGTVTTSAEVSSGPDEKGRLGFTVSAVDADGTVVADGEIDRVVVEREGFGG